MNIMNRTYGFGLVEIIIGAAIISAGILMILSSYTLYLQYALANQYNIQVAYLLEEGIEGVRFLKTNGWNKNIVPLSTTTTYYLAYGGGYWNATTVPQYIDGKFLRSFTLTDIKRDSNDKIAGTGTYDPLTKLLTVSVSFSDKSATTTKNMSMYITSSD